MKISFKWDKDNEVIDKAIKAINSIDPKDFTTYTYNEFVTAVNRLKFRKIEMEREIYKLPLTLAKYIINKAADEGKNVTTLRLQELLYLVYKEAVLDGIKDVIDSMSFEARNVIPTCKVVNDEYSVYGATPILREDVTDDEYDVIPDKVIEITDKVLKDNLDIPYWKLLENVKNDKAYNKAYKYGSGTIILYKDIEK